MAKVITAPEYGPYENKFALFLAGGITNCPDWQSDVIEGLQNLEGIDIFNPRRPNFPINDPTAGPQQIKWEYDHLHEADMILFWFPKESICPIALYELGFWIGQEGRKKKPLVIGCDPEYPRLFDVRIQTRLTGRRLILATTIPELIHSTKWTIEAVTRFTI